MAARIADIPPLEYKPLSVDPRGAFSCGVPEIDKWFKSSWKKHQNFNHRITTIHFEGDKQILAFYAMSMKLEEERMLTPKEKKSWRELFNPSGRSFVCLNLDYVAVRTESQSQGIGTIIMGKIIAEFASIASTCGIELMTGSAINPDRCRFYESLGFQKYGHADHRPQIFLPALSAMEIADIKD